MTKDKKSKRIRIAINGNEANEVRRDIGGRVGINNYAFKLFWELYRISLKEKSIEFTVFLKDKKAIDLPPSGDTWKYRILPGKGLWILSKLTPTLLFEGKYDVFFTPSHYLPFIPNIPKICVIHDLGYLVFSGQFTKFQYWQLKYWSAISIYISKYIITPSLFTKNDIVRHYKVSDKKIFDIHHGLDKQMLDVKNSKTVVRRILNKYKIKTPYILFVGALKPSKNIEGAVDGFAELLKKNPNNHLVIAGPKAWMYEGIFKKVKMYGITNKVTFTGFVTDEEKYLLIKNARIFLLPSFWEGFGMDVVNALYCGVPVVVSNAGSLPEVAGEVGTYIDPSDSKSISEGLSKVLDLPDLEYNRLIAQGKEFVSKFSWEKAARRTMDVLLKAAGNSN